MNRSILMGIAMIMVVIYHFFCQVYNPIHFFNIGYVGVDLFLFLSGMGLAESYKKNSIIQFYKNRFFRIYPIYFIGVISSFAIFKSNWGFDDLIANLFTFGFYTKGGVQRYDWYLESLFTLYLAFPLFVYFGKTRYVGIISLFIIVAVTLYNFNIPWYYDCVIGRLPVFLYGILFKECIYSYKTIAVIGLVLYSPCRLYISPFLASSLLTIPLILLFLQLIPRILTVLRQALSYIGKHSLEIYTANLYVCFADSIYQFNLLEKTVFYVFIQLVASYLLIKANNLITKHIFFTRKKASVNTLTH